MHPLRNLSELRFCKRSVPTTRNVGVGGVTAEARARMTAVLGNFDEDQRQHGDLVPR